MLMQKKLDRAMGWLQAKTKDEEAVNLEKNDLLAMIIAAIVVFSPIFIVLFFILYLVY